MKITWVALAFMFYTSAESKLQTNVVHAVAIVRRAGGDGS